MSDRKPNTTCPLCEAAPGFPCLTWNGREREPHADRPSVPTPPVPEGLDFEKAATEARKGMTTELFTEWEDRYRAALNAQVAEIVRVAREEERERCRKSVLDNCQLTCSCSIDYTARGLRDPSCGYCDVTKHILKDLEAR